MHKIKYDSKRKAVYLILKGKVKSDELRILKFRVYHFMKEYSVDHIIIDCKNTEELSNTLVTDYINEKSLELI